MEEVIKSVMHMQRLETQKGIAHAQETPNKTSDQAIETQYAWTHLH